MTAVGEGLASPVRTTQNGVDAPLWVVLLILGIAVVGFVLVVVLRIRDRRK